MKLYVYQEEGRRLVAVVNGESNDECERKASDAGYEDDGYGWTYTEPTVDGSCESVIDSSDAEVL